MDGSTSVALRARLIDDFNSNPAVPLFLLTTKVRQGEPLRCRIEEQE
jgi:hypothetical protein